MRLALALAAILSVSTLPAHSAPLQTAPGKTIEIGYYSFLKGDCSGGAKPSFKLSSPVVHGQLIVKSATLNTKRLTQCGEVKAPTLVVLYKADAAFTGSVPLSFDILNTESGQTQHVDARVDVAPERLKT